MKKHNYQIIIKLQTKGEIPEAQLTEECNLIWKQFTDAEGSPFYEIIKTRVIYKELKKQEEIEW